MPSLIAKNTTDQEGELQSARWSVEAVAAGE